MDNLEYSNDALEVIPDFYNSDRIVYVEGEDDLIFWDNIFKISNKNYHVIEVGGIEELKKYIDKIINEQVAIYVAKDNDYNDFYEDNIENDYIFTTYGHSIENTLYNLPTIKDVIKKFSRIQGHLLPQEINDEIEQYIYEFEQNIRPLLVYEIANDIHQKGISILGINSCKFLKNNSSVFVCENKVNTFITNINTNFDDVDLTIINDKIEVIEKPIWSLIRGHFLTNFVMNLIKKMVNKLSSKNINLPLDVIYPLFIDRQNIETSDDIYHYNYA